jgi:hypothetical protein
MPESNSPCFSLLLYHHDHYHYHHPHHHYRDLSQDASGCRTALQTQRRCPAPRRIPKTHTRNDDPVDVLTHIPRKLSLPSIRLRPRAMANPLLPISSSSSVAGSSVVGGAPAYPNGLGRYSYDTGMTPRSGRGVPVMLRRLTKFRSMVSGNGLAT